MKLSYKAYDRSGKTVCGTIDCAGVNAVAETLRQKGLYLAEASECAAGGHSGRKKRASRKIMSGQKTKNIALLARQLRVLLSSGTQLVEALIAMEEQTKAGAWLDAVTTLRNKVEEGASLSEAMKEQPGYFDAVCCSLVEAGESSGHLPEMLERLTALKQKQLQVRNTIVGALIYPCVLATIGASVFCMMLLFVVPKFAGLFSTLDVPLPGSTKALVAVSGFFRAYWWAGILLLLGCVGSTTAYLRTANGERFIHTAMLKLPYIGNVVKSLVTARIVRLLGVLLEGHVQVLDALGLIKNAAGNLHYTALIEKAEEYVTQGEPINLAFADTNLISPSVHAGIRSGEQSGQLAPLLLNIADFLDDENDIIVKSLTSIFEPVILVLMGGLVALIAISMFMPLFDLTAMTQAG